MDSPLGRSSDVDESEGDDRPATEDITKAERVGWSSSDPKIRWWMQPAYYPPIPPAWWLSKGEKVKPAIPGPLDLKLRLCSFSRSTIERFCL